MRFVKYPGYTVFTILKKNSLSGVFFVKNSSGKNAYISSSVFIKSRTLLTLSSSYIGTLIKLIAVSLRRVFSPTKTFFTKSLL
jgi:hypothetical protein